MQGVGGRKETEKGPFQGVSSETGPQNLRRTRKISLRLLKRETEHEGGSAFPAQPCLGPPGFILQVPRAP